RRRLSPHAMEEWRRRDRRDRGFPPDAGLDAFDWRVSMATVATDGAFSAFPGIDRTLSVLQGTLRLAVDGRDPMMLSTDDEPLAFAADIAVFGGPVGAPV